MLFVISFCKFEDLADNHALESSWAKFGICALVKAPRGSIIKQFITT